MRSKYSSIFLLEPWTTDTMMTTEATPMMIPSMVRTARTFFAVMDRMAILKACRIFISAPFRRCRRS